MKQLLVMLMAGMALAVSAKSAVAEKIAAKCRVTASDRWCGGERTVFELNGCETWVVEPDKPAAGNPWAWIMEWPGAFAERTGSPALIAAGYRVVTFRPGFYKDGKFVSKPGNMNDARLVASRAFQKFVVDELGFAPKANLIGMSWGGFFSTRYAAAHPENVRKIYYDAPLMNFHGFYPDDSATERPDRIGSWAAALGKGESWMDDPRMPINLAGRIAAAKIPVLLLYGGQDQTVPPLLNCEVFAARFKAAGGDIVVRKRGMFGHHPHGLDPNKTQTIVDFFTK